ncbi:unnamed protein product, partial [Coregonus sp. 'balchen']
VLESEQIPTSCNLFHNQDLYKYSVLPLPHCQIVISAHYSSARFDSSSCLQSHVSSSCYWIPHSTTPLDFPPDLLTLSQPPSLQPQPQHLYDLAKEMNPTDSATLHQTLVGQGALLEQHDQALKTLLEHIKEFSQSLSDLQGRPFAQSLQPVPSPSPPLWEPFVSTPEHYDGKLGACRAFLVQYSLVFEQQPYSYARERAKISYLIGCLRGAALSWAMAVWERQSPICFSYSRFTEEMKKVFDPPVCGKDAAKRLLSLRQGPHSVC